MGVYLKQFENHTQYESFTVDTDNIIKPNVSLCVQENEVHYNPYVPPYAGFCKLTLNDDSTVELEGSGELTSAMISDYKSTLVSAEIGTKCTNIGRSAFSKCYNLTSIDIPDSVTSIGNTAFNACSSLTSIDIPDSVRSIGSSVFNGCSSLTSIDIPDGVTSIGQSVFAGCFSLTSCTIGSGVTSIGELAFNTCSDLTSIEIPSGVTSIGDSAFNDCDNLTSIVCNAATAPTIQSSTFNGVHNNGTLTVPIGSSGYDVWMGTDDYYLGKYNWTKVEQ